jgi:hypothetical protein
MHSIERGGELKEKRVKLEKRMARRSRVLCVISSQMLFDPFCYSKRTCCQVDWRNSSKCIEIDESICDATGGSYAASEIVKMAIYKLTAAI